MAIKLEVNNDKSSMRIDGELTIYSVLSYKKSLARRKFATDKILELDLADVEEIDASGLQFLLALNKKLSANGSGMNIVRASDTVVDSLETCEFEAEMQFEPEGGAHES